MTDLDARDLINRLFEEEALALGGLAALHEVDDDLVQRLIGNMSAIRARALSRLENRRYHNRVAAVGNSQQQYRPPVRIYAVQFGCQCLGHVATGQFTGRAQSDA